jgi:signal transduction histidine kinase
VTDPSLVDRLAAHRTLSAAPREQLEWLAAHGELRRFEKGQVVGVKGVLMRELAVILSGHLVIRIDQGSGVRRIVEWHAGDVTGYLPFSRLSSPPGNTTAEEPSEMLMVDHTHFPEMVATCFDLTGIFVHVMVDRARRFTRGDLHEEKMVSLGRLAAGLAHELNNPASAVARSARELSARLFELEAATLALGAGHLTAEQLAAVSRVRRLCDEADRQTDLSPMQRADREDAVAAWLERHGVRDETSEMLTDSAVSVDCLEPLGDVLDREAMEFALRSIAASHRASRLASEIETAAARVHSLVAAVKGFTYMDQSAALERVRIAKGLADTLAVLGAKARTKSLSLTIDAGADLPDVQGRGGELNQVWANLIDNAIDAAPESGHVTVRATERDGSVVVSVVDDGPGMAPEQLGRIFEPFFTTKPPGQGTGLGLDIARRIVQDHAGKIEVESRPGHTEFKVILPRA